MEIIKSEFEIKDFLPIFATEAFLKTKSERYGWFYEAPCILPFYIDKKLIFQRLILPNETVYIGPAPSIESEQAFLGRVLEIARTLGVHFIAQPPTNVVFRTYPEGSTEAPFGSYQVDLSLDEETLFKNLHSKHRNVIRKAQRDGVEIIRGAEHWQECFEVLKETFVRQNMAYPSLEDIKTLKEELHENLAFYMTRKDGVTQGVAIIPWNIHGAYYLYGGSISQPYGGSLNLMHWQIMLDMKGKGVKLYDFVGARLNPPPESKFAGLQMFKERFGAVMKKGFLWKYPVNPGIYRLYQMVQSGRALLRGKKPEGDVIDQERKGL